MTRTDQPLRLLDDRDAYMRTLGGCSDGGCIIAKPIGIHTNGGCKCSLDGFKMQRVMYMDNKTIAALRSILSAQGESEPSAEATPEMCDSVRYLIVGIEQSGRTFAAVRKHCELSGMDTSHWPAWTMGHDREHFNKAACAALLWHCMEHARLAGKEKADG